MESALKLRVAVIGGSLGGLTAAIRLSRGGSEVDVFERSRRPLEGRGAGIVLHPKTVAVLDDDTRALSARAVRMRYIDGAGRVTHDVECSYRFTSYFALHRMLLDQFDRAHYHLDSEVIRFDQKDGRARVTTSRGEQGAYDLLVCADGIHSTARRRLLPDVRPEYAGYVGWRGTVLEDDLTATTFQTLTEAISYCIVPNGHILIYPIPGLDGSLKPGRRLINWVWYRNVDTGPELDSLLTDRAGVRQPVSLGSGAVRETVIEELRADAGRLLPPPLAEMVSRSPEPFVQVILDIAVPRMAFNSIAIIGDAAFALRPHVAAGTAKAAEDAETLSAAVLSQPEDVAAALARWEGPRLTVGEAAMERARLAGARAQFENTWQSGDSLPFGLHRDGDSRLR